MTLKIKLAATLIIDILNYIIIANNKLIPLIRGDVVDDRRSAPRPPMVGGDHDVAAMHRRGVSPPFLLLLQGYPIEGLLLILIALVVRARVIVRHDDDDWELLE